MVNPWPRDSVSMTMQLPETRKLNTTKRTESAPSHPTELRYLDLDNRNIAPYPHSYLYSLTSDENSTRWGSIIIWPTETVTHNPNRDAFSKQLTKEPCRDVQPPQSRSPQKWLQSTPTDQMKTTPYRAKRIKLQTPYKGHISGKSTNEWGSHKTAPPYHGSIDPINFSPYIIIHLPNMKKRPASCPSSTPGLHKPT